MTFLNFKKFEKQKRASTPQQLYRGTKEFQLENLVVELLFFRFSGVHRGPWTVDHSQLELVLT